MSWIDADENELSLSRQCELASVARSRYYYQPALESQDNLRLMRLLDEQYTQTPFYGVLKMTQVLKQQGEAINVKRVRRLMRKMGLEAIYPKARLSQRNGQDAIYPYLLRDLEIKEVNQVWSTDITYIPLQGGFVYLVAVIDWFSRYVLSWELSNTMDVYFCLHALEKALHWGTPVIFNTDQGSQFTSQAFTSRLLKEKIQISMDGRGRALDNIFVERLWRSLKYEDIYLKNYESVRAARDGIRHYFLFYNQQRLHQALHYKTPQSIYFASKTLPF